MNTMQRIFAFPWLKENRLAFFLTILALFAIPFAAVAILLAMTGREGAIGVVVLFEAIGVVLAALTFAFVYGWVGRRTAQARADFQIANPELESPCLIVRDMIQAPGSALLKDGHLFLVPAVGKPIDVDLERVQAEEREKWFNGSMYPGQSGFWFKGPSISWRLGFMPDTPDAWRDVLQPVENLGAKH